MAHFVLRRFVSALLLVLLVSFVSYVLIFAAGDPAVRIAGEAARAADAERIRQLYRLDQPIPVQYLRWLGNILSGDLGRSLYFDQPVTTILLSRLFITFKLGACAIVFALAVAVPLGIAAARWPNTIIDRAALVLAVLGQAMPTFWFGLLLVILFGVTYPILPISGDSTWLHFVLPTIVLGYFAAPAIMRLTRSGMIAVLETDYIRTARAMGIRPRTVLFSYALRNALIPVVSVAAAQFGHLLAGSVVIESVFAINGAGRLAWESILRSDLATIQALILVFSVVYIVVTLLADILNGWLDPQLRV